jgi:DNA invertase Pin-like site-specific DNA recombinase
MTYIAYYRVSTDRQGRSGLGLEAQRSAVLAHIAGGQLLSEYTEIESGRKTDRPQLLAALAAAKKAKATLIIAKLDRLARNVHFISGLLESGVAFRCADMPEADRTWLQMSAVFAEWEARKIGERTSAALQAAKARGVVLGSPSPEKGAAAVSDAAQRYALTLAPVIAEIRAAGAVTLRDIAAQLQARSVKTARGGLAWSAQQVSNLINRLNQEEIAA